MRRLRAVSYGSTLFPQVSVLVCRVERVKGKKKLDRAGVGVLFDKISVLTLSIQKDKSEQIV